MRLSKYTDLKDAAAEWVGRIPLHWEETRLRYIADISNSNVDKKEYEGQVSVRLCNYTDVYYNEVITPDLNFMIATASKAETKKFGLKLGDVIITKDSEDPLDIGIPAIVDCDIPGVVCGYHLSIIRAEDPITADYIRYSFMSDVNKARMYVRTPGITRFGLNQDTIKNILVLLPSMEERAKIVAALRRETARIDGMIERKGRFIELLKEKRTALISHAVTKGIDADVPMKDSGQDWLGKIPEHWSIFSASRLFVERDTRSKTGDEEMLTVSHLTGVTPRYQKTVNMIEAESTVGYKICHAGDLVVNTLWAWMGAMGTAPMVGIVSPAYNVYTPKTHLVHHAYVDYLVKHSLFAKEVTRFSKGVWSSRLRLYPEGLREIRMPVPPIVSQKKIASHLDRETRQIEGIIAKTKRSIELLKEKRSALITAAVTGKIDVRSAA